MRVGESQATAAPNLPLDKPQAASPREAAPRVAGDRLTLSTPRAAASAPTHFSLGRALGHFGHGLVAQARDMVQGMVKHPLMTLGMLGLGAAAVAAAPLVGLTAATVGTAMTVGFGAVAAWHMGKAGLTAVNDYRRGDTAKAEADFEDLGRGTFDAAMAVGPAAAGKLVGALKGSRAAVAATEIAPKAELMGPAKPGAPAVQTLLKRPTAPKRLSLVAEPPIAPPKPLDLATMRAADAPIQEFGKLNQEARDALQAYYSEIYQDADLNTRAKELIKGWTSGGKGKEELRQAFVNVVLDGKDPATPMEHTLADMAVTRRMRLDRVAAKLGIQTPDSFHLYRGVRGDYAVEPLVKAWADESTPDMVIPHKEVASWSLNRETAEYFASGKEPSVIYEADVPFNRTLIDKWADGHSLANMYSPQDEVVVAATHDTLKVPKATASVTYQGKTYTYADRQALIQAWHEDHPQ